MCEERPGSLLEGFYAAHAGTVKINLTGATDARERNLQLSKYFCAFAFPHGALRPAWDCRLKAKYLVAVRGNK